MTTPWQLSERSTSLQVNDIAEAALTIADNAQVNGAALGALKAEVNAVESYIVCQLNRRFAGHFRAELNSNAGLRDTLGTVLSHSQRVQAFGNTYDLNGWVHAIVFAGSRFIEPGCTAVHSVCKNYWHWTDC